MFIAVAVPVPFLDLLTYRVPESMITPAVGARVRVPLGTRVVTGVVVETAMPPADVELRDVVEVLDATSYVPPGIVELCRWAAEYYVAGIGDTVAVALPPGAKRRASAFRTRRVAAITAHGMQMIDPQADIAQAGERLTARQIAALEVLAGATPGLPTAELRDRGVTADMLGRLATRGLVAFRDEQEDRDPFERSAMASVGLDSTRQLTAEQEAAVTSLSALADTREFRVALLQPTARQVFQ